MKIRGIERTTAHICSSGEGGGGQKRLRLNNKRDGSPEMTRKGAAEPNAGGRMSLFFYILSPKGVMKKKRPKPDRTRR